MNSDIIPQFWCHLKRAFSSFAVSGASCLRFYFEKSRFSFSGSAPWFTASAVRISAVRWHGRGRKRGEKKWDGRSEWVGEGRCTSVVGPSYQPEQEGEARTCTVAQSLFVLRSVLSERGAGVHNGGCAPLCKHTHTHRHTSAIIRL